MIQIATSNWWVLAIRGLIAILFGILTFAWPGITLTFLALIFGVYALLDGVFSLVAVFRGGQSRERWWGLLIEGVLGIIAGIVTFIAPPATVVALVYIIAAWAVITGIMEISAAIHLRRHVKGEWLLILMGIVSILLGLLLMSYPTGGAVVLAYWIAAYAIVFGGLMIALAFRLKSHPGLPIVANL